MRRRSRKAQMPKRRMELQYLQGRILYHECSVCDNRRGDFLGVYQACRDEAANTAVKGMAAGGWRGEMSGWELA